MDFKLDGLRSQSFKSDYDSENPGKKNPADLLEIIEEEVPT